MLSSGVEQGESVKYIYTHTHLSRLLLYRLLRDSRYSSCQLPKYYLNLNVLYYFFKLIAEIFHRAKAFQLNKQESWETPPIIENKSFQISTKT